MNSYELMFLMRPESAEALVDEHVDRYTELIKKAEGSVGEVTRWGRKRMAYLIDNHRDAIYTILHFESNGSTNIEMERLMRLDSEVIRFLTVRLDLEMRNHHKQLKKAEVALANKPAKAPAIEQAPEAAPPEASSFSDSSPAPEAPAE